jgi:hypothetical protein
MKKIIQNNKVNNTEKSNNSLENILCIKDSKIINAYF